MYPMDEWEFRDRKIRLYLKEHPANCPLGWRLSNDMRVYLSWLQVGLGHHTRKPNRWSVHQRCLVTSCSSPFLQPPTSCNTSIYEWQCQAASFKGSNCLPSTWSRDFSFMASHELGFQSDEVCLWHARPSCAVEPHVQNLRHVGIRIYISLIICFRIPLINS
jgi:hypothetical protein